MVYRLAQPGVIRKGTAREEAEHVTGFSANGLSEYTRASAHSNPIVHERGTFRNRLDVVERYKHEIHVLRKRMAMENNPERMLKLSKDLQIKTHLLARMLRGEARS